MGRPQTWAFGSHARAGQRARAETPVGVGLSTYHRERAREDFLSGGVARKRVITQALGERIKKSLT